MDRMRAVGVRFNTKVIFTFMVTSSVCLIVSLWLRPDCNDRHLIADGVNTRGYKDCNDFDENIEVAEKPKRVSHQNLATTVPYSPLPCVINGDTTVECRRENGEVYLPFSFIEKYFEVYGKVTEDADGKDVFDWQHSYSIVYPQAAKYDPSGVFMSFEHYNVETRSRVKCITATDEVPLSIQWGPTGYYYPIQIAQYGLSHYSKQIVDEPARVISLANFDDAELSNTWQMDKTSTARIVRDGTKGRVMEFDTDVSLANEGVSLPVGKKPKFILSLDFHFINNGSIVVVLKTSDNKYVDLNYVQSSNIISLHGTTVYYGLGNFQSTWRRIERDIVLDYTKGAMLKYKKSARPKMRNLIARIVSVGFRGHGFTDNITLMTSSHMTPFFAAADWLVKNQDSRGGWPINVHRRLIPNIMELKPGWYSAMAQGQAMSILVRAYLKTNNRRYLTSALAASKLFSVPSTKGGVATKFVGVYDWYEEYPTIPSSFVLNGFIFSLIGLYDLKEVGVNEPEISTVVDLYNSGMKSLRALVNLFDSGSGSIYDLRHMTVGLAPNLARWDYHATHVIQLNLLATIDGDPVFSRTAERWLEYMKGLRADHN